MPAARRALLLIGAALALLLPAVGALPWFVHEIAVQDDAGVRTETYSATAWGASTRWALAVACGAAAGVAAAVALRLPGLAPVVPALAAAGLVLLGWQVLDVQRLEGERSRVAAIVGRGDAPAVDSGWQVQRDRLLVQRTPGVERRLGAGVAAGAAVLALQGVVGSVAARGGVA